MLLSVSIYTTSKSESNTPIKNREKTYWLIFRQTKSPLKTSDSLGYNFISDNGINGLGTLYPLFYQFTLFWNLFDYCNTFKHSLFHAYRQALDRAGMR